jgi:hypothetical protein
MKTRVAVLLSCAGIVCGLMPMRADGESEAEAIAQWEAELRDVLESRDLDPIRQAERVETFVLEDVTGRSPADFPSATVVETDLPGDFVAFPEREPMDLALGQELAQLLLDRQSYKSWISACLFSPGVAIRFHRGERAVDAFICFHCREIAFQAVGSRESPFKRSFDEIGRPLLALVRRARPQDVRLPAIEKEWDEADERARAWAADEDRWRDAMPVLLRPYWEKMRDDLFTVNLKPWRRALAAQFPERRDQILALLDWNGAGAGSWTAGPSYERAAEGLLLSYPTAALVGAVSDRELTPRQTEGAARLFAGRRFRIKNKGHAPLDAALRERLLRRSLENPDEENRTLAQEAFAGSAATTSPPLTGAARGE